MYAHISRIREPIWCDIGAQLDADPPGIVTLETRFRTSRIVPLHPTTAEKLQTYASGQTEVIVTSPFDWLRDVGIPVISVQITMVARLGLL
ncbi:hypothetical protein [Paraburkholderia lacunae]|nr:hypothetical protein [Paraburkholderia lacunae]